MAIHVILCAYFGDYEYDIGKSVRWSQYFADTVYIRDINVGQGTRNFIVAWDAVFPQVKFSYATSSFFTNATAAATWRQDAFNAADAAWNYAASDWVLFVDGTEGLCIDDRAGIPVVGSDPFKGWLTYEIGIAEAASRTSISLPMYAFLRQTISEIQRPIDPATTARITYLQGLSNPTQAEQDELALLLQVSDSTHMLTAAKYVSAGNFVRLAKVSALRSGFSWTSLDTVSGVTAAVNLNLLSYAYARWSDEPSYYDATNGTVSDQSKDKGFEMRTLISQVRAIAGVPLTWGSADPAGLTGPPQTGYYMNAGTINLPQLRTPLYSSVFRDNPLDGVYYVYGEKGPVPWDYLRNQPSISPGEWAGIEAQVYDLDPITNTNVLRSPIKTGAARTMGTIPHIDDDNTDALRAPRKW